MMGGRKMRLRLLTALVLIGLPATPAGAYTWTSDWLLDRDLRSPSLSRNNSQWPCLCALPGYSSYSGTYLWNSGSGWSSETIPSSNHPVTHFSDLTFDTLGYPHTTTKLDWSWDFIHLYKSASGWHQELLADDVTYWSRILRDDSNNLHVIYSYNSKLYYRKRTSSGWSTPTIICYYDAPGYGGDSHGDMALDADGHPHITHNLYESPKGIEHDYWDGYAWRSEYIETGSSSFGRSEVEIDAGGRIHVLYHKGDSVKYAIRDRDGWHISGVAGSYTYPWMSLALDYRGLARAAACKSVSQLNYLTYDGSSWTSETIISSVDANGTQLDLGLSGEPFIGYGDYTNHYVRVAHPQYYPPGTFTLLDPANGAWANASPFFRWNPCSYLGDSLTRYELWIDGAYNRSVTPPTITACHPASPLTSGWHTWKVLAIKTTGDSVWSSATWSVQIDASGPLAFNLQTPADSAWTVQRHPTFTWTASSDAQSGLRKYQIMTDGFRADDSVPATQTSAPCPVSLPDGAHIWNIRAVDNAGNYTTSNQTWTIRVDSTGPNWFNLISPANGSWTGNSRPTFTWHPTTDAGVGLRCYELWTRLSGDTWALRQGDITDTTYTPQPSQALTHGAWYWMIRAVDSLGNYTATYQWTLHVDLVPPLSFHLASPANNAVVQLPTPTFYWQRTTDADAGLSHYELWIDSLLNVDNLVDTFSAPSSPLPEGPHRWSVKAVDSVGNVRPSTETWTVYLDWTPPDTFSLSYPPDNDTAYMQQPNLYWHPAHDVGSGIRKYRLYVNGVVSRDSVSAAETTATPSSPLPFGSHVPWYVVAFDRADGSRSSNQTWYINVAHDSISPTVPALVHPDSASLTRDSLPRFTWRHSTDDRSGVDHYTLQYATNSGFAGAVSVDVVDTTYQVTTRLLDTTWYWRVRAQDKAGNPSAWSSVWHFEIDSKVPVPPTLLEPPNGAWCNTASVVFRWSAVATGRTSVTLVPTLSVASSRRCAQDVSATDNVVAPLKQPASPVRYVIQVDTSSGFVAPVIDETTADAQDTFSLGERRHFWWRVRAYDSAGNQGSFSVTDSFGVDLTAPSVPTLVAPPNDTTLADTTVALVWHRSLDQMSGLANYRVQVAYDTAFMALVCDTALADTSCHRILPESLYYWRVNAADSAVNVCAWSSLRRFRLSFVPGVEECAVFIPTEFGLLHPVPQPFSASVVIPYALPAAAQVRLVVYNSMGRRVAELVNCAQPAGLHKVSWEGRDLDGRVVPSGVYMARLSTAGRTQTQKLVVERRSWRR